MSRTVPGWSGGDIYRDNSKLTKLVSLEKEIESPRRKYVFSDTRVQYEVYCRDVLNVNPRDEKRVVRITEENIQRLRGSLIFRDEVVFLEGWWMGFKDHGRIQPEILEPLFLRAEGYRR